MPEFPFYVLVLQGRGMFAGRDRQEHEYGANALLVFEAGEPHTVRALDDTLVFISYLPAVDNMRTERTGGEIGRE